VIGLGKYYEKAGLVYDQTRSTRHQALFTIMGLLVFEPDFGLVVASVYYDERNSPGAFFTAFGGVAYSNMDYELGGSGNYW